jgi:hypothetical protein
MYLPTYNRGESTAGYVSRCSTTNDMIKNVSSNQVRVAICKEHVEQIRNAMRQPFSKDLTSGKLSQKK